MGEEHDSWLGGIGVDVVDFLESVPQKIEEAVSSVVNEADASDEPVCAGPGAEAEVCQEPDDDEGISIAPQAVAASSAAAVTAPAPPTSDPKAVPAKGSDSSTSKTKSEVPASENRPEKPSNPAKLLSTAKSAATKSAGKCYAAFKRNVKAAGGYGDVLDIYTDERFAGCQVSAVQFADAVKTNGAANLGLEEVSGADPRGAKPGTILVLKGNGNGLISDAHGDISVVGETAGGLLNCHNDGRMQLYADDKSWASGGRHANMMVAMYIPIARSAD
jgi:hypothetical protein